LLDAVRPRLAVISLGRRNRFRFPHEEVLRRYDARLVRTLRTDLLGAITLRIGGDGRIDEACARGCR
jgi:competence protein ComEC